MLLFIFSNSSCSFPRILISIHLMLLFIISSPCLFSPFFKFQYISCYCLSVPFNKFLFCYIHFNTSHVTVYRNGRVQPNSCKLISIHLMLLFINPCDLRRIRSVNFNTSHVTVYLELMENGTFHQHDFNTSHVTVYLCQNGTSCNHSIISIHLMLLFI